MGYEFDIMDFVGNYLGVDEEDLLPFIRKRRRDIDYLLGKYGFPLSEKSLSSTDLSPLEYKSRDCEMILDYDFGLFAGTHANVEVLEKKQDIIVYRFI